MTSGGSRQRARRRRVRSDRIVGPGGARDRGAVLVDTRDAVLLAEQVIALVDSADPDAPTVVALSLRGRVNRQQEEREQLYLMDVDGAANMVVEIFELFHRASEQEQAEFVVAFEARQTEAKKERDANRPDA